MAKKFLSFPTIYDTYRDFDKPEVLMKKYPGLISKSVL
jgi:hypothetical protein